MRIAVLYGNLSENTSKDEQDGLVQVESVSQALLELNHDPVPVSFSLDVKETLQKIAEINPALVFNLVESIDGQGRLIHLAPSILDAMNIAYTGAGTRCHLYHIQQDSGQTDAAGAPEFRLLFS